ncbi:hypothetical protein D3C76_121820 [compost metagenome]
MYTLQIGSFLLNGQILLILAFGAMGWLAFRSYSNRRSLDKDFEPLAFNAFIIWFLIWKGSILIFEPATTLQHPLTLLYYDGGIKGRWIATAAAAIYLAYKIIKGKAPWQTALALASVYILGGTAAYQIGLLWFEPALWLFHLSYVMMALLILLAFYLDKQPGSWTSLLRKWVWGCIALAVICFLNPERTQLILSFSIQQMILMLFGLVAFIFMSNLEKRE